ncbi:hypothetical protein [Aquabacterium sp. J223]|uniref:hypothetical protein n=1 Tax=Aquabacterium sp. J223 TaxID=2898431 RepID=UPI0021AD8C7E|nr:hypothetical protein [Aquabacterium sp. J223]UUX97576.1 hypothetical protein LRS07_10240 [Aquabacterium sp. J223]
MTASHATPVPPQHSSGAFRSTGQDEEFHVGQGAPTLLGLLDDALMEWERYATPGITTGADWHFGDAGSGENGIRSAANFVFASAFRWKQYGNQLGLDWARRGLDYLLAGHRTGEGACADGQRWGHAWQSSWWCGKMALGAHLIWAELSRQRREAVARVVASEAGALLLRAVPTGLALDTKAEENAWDTEVLASALLLMPEHPDRGAWAEKLNAFAMNTLSRAVDHERLDLVEGKPVADWLTSANLFHDFTIENHGSCHFCYVASPLASLTWARASFLLSGRPAPESLSFNKAAFWNKHKSLFLDRRFAYVGGQDWARYTYGEYFIVPAAVSIAASLDDRFAQHVAAQRVKMLRLEQRRNGDGSFFSRRVTRRLYQGQAAKYETDCFAHLALARLLLDLEPATSEGPADRVVRPVAVHLGYETQVAWTRTEAFLPASVRKRCKAESRSPCSRLPAMTMSLNGCRETSAATSSSRGGTRPICACCRSCLSARWASGWRGWSCIDKETSTPSNNASASRQTPIATP